MVYCFWLLSTMYNVILANLQFKSTEKRIYTFLGSREQDVKLRNKGVQYV